ncbi:MAG TPA: hypothetical protein VMS71_06455 [Candidatus Acidoferrum sp.]|nr:hypothetical protein [Candidatus Acidoferrum sp.]
MCIRKFSLAFLILLFSLCSLAAGADQERRDRRDRRDRTTGSSLYDIPPRMLVDMPTAGTLPRGYYDIGLRLYAFGGALGYTDIGLSSRLQIGLSYGAEQALSSENPQFNPDMEFGIKFRLVDELEYFPAVTLGFSSQGNGGWSKAYQRYAYKSRGFYAVVSRGIYFYRWTSGWHLGVNYSYESKVDEDKDLDFFGGFDATFDYNLAFCIEYDAAINDNKTTIAPGQTTPFSGKGRGYLNSSIKWLFTDNLELEVILKDLLVNRRESRTITREMRLTYINRF